MTDIPSGPAFAYVALHLRQTFEDLAIIDTSTVSCEDGEYVRGIAYDIEEVSTDTSASFTYYINNIYLMCSSADLGERIRTGVQQRMSNIYHMIGNTYFRCLGLAYSAYIAGRADIVPRVVARSSCEIAGCVRSPV